jgi:hypothetical protein
MRIGLQTGSSPEKGAPMSTTIVETSNIAAQPEVRAVVRTNEEPWLKRLEDPRAEVRRQAVEEGRTYGAEAVLPVSRILAEDHDEGVRELAVSVLKSLKDPLAIPYLHQAVLSDTGRVGYPAVDAICQIGGAQAIAQLINLTSRVDTKLHCYILAALGAPHLIDTTGYLSRTVRQGGDPKIQRAAARALGKARRIEAVPDLLAAFEEARDSSVRRTILEVLGEFKDERALPLLGRTLIKENETDVRHAAANAMQAAPGDWRVKAQHILRLLAEGNAQRSDIDAAAILLAITPSGEAGSSAFILTDYFIEQAAGASEQMQPNLAELIIASVGRSTEAAGDRVSYYQKKQGLPDEQFERLRIEIGGGKALAPILRVLHEDLKKNFQDPINDLNSLTQKQWQRTIFFSQIGFFVRMIMSVVVFFAGMILLYFASRELLFGNLAPERLLGPGISFASGLGTMLLVIYTGPLKEIRRSMIDLGAASASFIAFVHRVLQVSHTFSAYYLDRKMTFAENTTSCALIEKAMRDTVAMLCLASGRSSIESSSEGTGQTEGK